MRIDLFRSTWGIDASWEVVFPTIAQQGYRGVELGVPLEQREQTNLVAQLTASKLEYIAMVFTSGADLTAHITSAKQQVEAAVTCGARQITLHGWRDSSNYNEGCQFIEAIIDLEQHYGIAIGHETHRGRLFFNPWWTDMYLSRYTDAHICADYSHWVVVAERNLTDEESIIERCAAHCIHLHTRVGHSQGPQVPDPKLPRYSSEVAAHEHWWQLAVSANQHAGKASFSMTPEYGPPPYQSTDFATNAPLQPLSDIVAWQSERIRTLFPNT
ncbi:MAG: hypothetical protein NT020_14535 [Chloroflexales bacterium]|nr:hypothetical protein [Chloroflexales bacterium]